MLKQGFDKEKFRKLLQKAIGENPQYSFADKAGISRSRLNHLLNDQDTGRPSRTTITKIAEASDGKISEEQLLSVCGYIEIKSQENSETIPNDTNILKHTKESILKYTQYLKKGVHEISGVSTKYVSIESILDTVCLLYGPSQCRYLIQKEEPYQGKGHKGAEMYVHCTLVYAEGDFNAKLAFILFFCKTIGGGIIISDSAFDLSTLFELRHPEATTFLLDMAEKGDVQYTDFPVVLRVTQRNIEAEERLLARIFGTD